MTIGPLNGPQLALIGVLVTEMAIILLLRMSEQKIRLGSSGPKRPTLILTSATKLHTQIASQNQIGIKINMGKEFELLIEETDKMRSPITAEEIALWRSRCCPASGTWMDKALWRLCCAIQEDQPLPIKTKYVKRRS
jgi:hypothetical protein